LAEGAATIGTTRRAYHSANQTSHSKAPLTERRTHPLSSPAASLICKHLVYVHPMPGM